MFNRQLKVNRQLQQMSVKPQIFQQTKQTILKNKKQFIQIQLNQVNKRIATLKIQNNQLKGQIKVLKFKSNKLSAHASHKNSDDSKHHKNSLADGSVKKQQNNKNKQNHCKNKAKLIDHQLSSQTWTQRSSNAKVGRNQKNCKISGNVPNLIKKINFQDTDNELKVYEDRLAEQQKLKQRELQELQEYIQALKKLWRQKQQINMNINTNRSKTIDYDVCQRLMPNKISEDASYLNKNCRKVITKSQTSTNNELGKSDIETFRNRHQTNVRPQPLLLFNQASTQRDFSQPPQQPCLNSSTTSQYTSDFLLPQKNHDNCSNRRKTMSVSLNSSGMNQTPGFFNAFNFGKKPFNKVSLPMEQSYQYNIPNTNRQPPGQSSNQVRKSSASMMIFMNPSNSQKTHNNMGSSLNNSLSHSNSRSSMSFTSNGSRSKLKRTQASKSYAKIVTKLICCGCKVEYRPNQYYCHIQNCRQYLKIKLLQQKSKIQDQINQTLNLSIPII